MNLLYLQLSFLKYNKNEWAFSSIRTSKEGSHWLKNTIYSSHFHAETHKFRGTGKRYFMAVISLGMDTFLSRLSCEPQGSGRFQAVKNGTLQDSSWALAQSTLPQNVQQQKAGWVLLIAVTLTAILAAREALLHQAGFGTCYYSLGSYR